MTSCVYQLELGNSNYHDSISRYFPSFLQEQTKKPYFVIMMYLLWTGIEPEGPSFVFIYAQEINSHEMKCQGCFPSAQRIRQFQWELNSWKVDVTGVDLVGLVLRELISLQLIS